MRVLAALFAALALPGCMTVTALGDTFEGGADFTVVPASDVQDARSAANHPACAGRTCVDLGRTDRFLAKKPKSDAADVFRKKDNIYLSVKTGTIGWFSEGAEQHALNRFVEFFGARSPLKGEIAIIANVTEGKRKAGGINEKGEREGRIVFYSGDVYRHQRLNDFNFPIYGPAAYGGGPLTVDLWIMELDRAESDQMGAVLSTLESLAKTIVAPGIPGFDILSQLGTSFLKANQDDVIGHIGFTMKPPEDVTILGDLPLMASDVIYRRAEVRDFDLNFDGCVYVVEQGSIFGCKAQDQKDNYLILSIRKTGLTESVTPDAIDLAELNKRISASPSATALTTAMNEVSDRVVGNAMGNSSVAQAAKVVDKSVAANIRQLDADPLVQQLQCYLLVRSSATEAVMNQVCGDRAKSRQMPEDDFKNVVERLVVAGCATPADFSSSALIGSEPTKSTLAPKKDALVQKLLLACPTPPAAAA